MQEEFKTVFDRRLLKDTPFCVLKEILGWNTCPDFASQWATLLAGCRFHCRPLDTRMTDPALHEVAWPQLFPTIQPVLEKLEWWADDCGRYIYRADTYGSVRRFKVGHDSPSILHEWLCDFHRERELRQCARIRQKFHLDDPQCATGLDLPAPLRQGFACLLVSLGLRMDPNTSNMLLWLLGAVFGTNSLVAALLIRGICVGIVAVVFTSLAEFTLCGRALKLHICAHRMRRCIELKSVFSPKSFKSVPALSAAF